MYIGKHSRDDYYCITLEFQNPDWTWDNKKLLCVAAGEEVLLRALVANLKILAQTRGRCDKHSIHEWLGYEDNPTPEQEALFRIIDQDFLMFGGCVEKIVKIERVFETRQSIDLGSI